MTRITTTHCPMEADGGIVFHLPQTIVEASTFVWFAIFLFEFFIWEHTVCRQDGTVIRQRNYWAQNGENSMKEI